MTIVIIRFTSGNEEKKGANLLKNLPPVLPLGLMAKVMSVL
jgi:hypothetical protein